MRRCLLSTFVSSLLFTTIHSVHAQEAAEEEDLYLLYGDDEMISIATGVSQPIAVAPSTASVITADDIKAMGATTLDQVLERVPGVHVAPSQQNPLNNFIFRGIKTTFTPQVLILLNGHRISADVYTGSLIDGSVTSIENISRIEIIRGPGSAVYGADAFSGVVNIITKSADELNGTHAGARTGSFDLINAWGQYGGEINKNWKIATSLEYASRSADESRIVNSDLQSVLDLPPAEGGFGTSASLAPSYLDDRYEAVTYNLHMDSENWKVGFDGSVQRDNGSVAGIAQVLDHEGSADIEQHLFTLEYENNNFSENWEFSSGFSYQVVESQNQLNIFPAGTVLLIGDDGNAFSIPSNALCPTVPGLGQACIVSFPDGYIGHPGRKTTSSQLDFTFLYDAFEDHTLRVNVGAKNEKLEANESKNFGFGVINGTQPVVDGVLTNVTGVENSVYVSDEDRQIGFLSFQDIWQLAPDWSLTAGVRYDNYSDFGSTTNPRLAFVWSPTINVVTKLLYGTAFRAPSFSELYSQNNPVALGTESLNPEEIETYEFAVSYFPFQAITLGLNIYSYETDGMVDFVDDGSGTNTNVAANSKDLEGEGFELEIDWAINSNLRLISNYANQSTKNKSTGIQESFIPEQQLYADLRWNVTQQWLVSSQVNWIADRKRVEGDLREDISDYTLLDLSLRYKSNDNWEAAISSKNLLDNDALEPSNGDIPDDYPLNERSINFELRYHMK